MGWMTMRSRVGSDLIKYEQNLYMKEKVYTGVLGED